MAGLFIRRLLACVVPVMLASEVLAGGVVIFDAPGLGVLPNIQSAVNAATSGDVLLIAPGSYPSFTIDGKSLNVFALPGDAVHVDGTITITNIGARPRQHLRRPRAVAKQDERRRVRHLARLKLVDVDRRTPTAASIRGTRR
ncbi:MAG: hypothetical protein IT454_15105 [Planctomycetes bacterium]|nr:hypothetical protein [Planctomycetota bacterium]